MNTKEIERLSTIEKTIDKRLTQMIAAQYLGVTVRQIKRLVKKYKQYGPERFYQNSEAVLVIGNIWMKK